MVQVCRWAKHCEMLIMELKPMYNDAFVPPQSINRCSFNLCKIFSKRQCITQRIVCHVKCVYVCVKTFHDYSLCPRYIYICSCSDCDVGRSLAMKSGPLWFQGRCHLIDHKSVGCHLIGHESVSHSQKRLCLVSKTHRLNLPGTLLSANSHQNSKSKQHKNSTT